MRPGRMLIRTILLPLLIPMQCRNSRTTIKPFAAAMRFLAGGGFGLPSLLRSDEDEPPPPAPRPSPPPRTSSRLSAAASESSSIFQERTKTSFQCCICLSSKFTEARTNSESAGFQGNNDRGRDHIADRDRDYYRAIKVRSAAESASSVNPGSTDHGQPLLIPDSPKPPPSTTTSQTRKKVCGDFFHYGCLRQFVKGKAADHRRRFAGIIGGFDDDDPRRFGPSEAKCPACKTEMAGWYTDLCRKTKKESSSSRRSTEGGGPRGIIGPDQRGSADVANLRDVVIEGEEENYDVGDGGSRSEAAAGSSSSSSSGSSASEGVDAEMAMMSDDSYSVHDDHSESSDERGPSWFSRSVLGGCSMLRDVVLRQPQQHDYEPLAAVDVADHHVEEGATSDPRLLTPDYQFCSFLPIEQVIREIEQELDAEASQGLMFPFDHRDLVPGEEFNGGLVGGDVFTHFVPLDEEMLANEFDIRTEAQRTRVRQMIAYLSYNIQEAGAGGELADDVRSSEALLADLPLMERHEALARLAAGFVRDNEDRGGPFPPPPPPRIHRRAAAAMRGRWRCGKWNSVCNRVGSISASSVLLFMLSSHVLHYFSHGGPWEKARAELLHWKNVQLAQDVEHCVLEKVDSAHLHDDSLTKSAWRVLPPEITKRIVNCEVNCDFYSTVARRGPAAPSLFVGDTEVNDQWYQAKEQAEQNQGFLLAELEALVDSGKTGVGEMVGYRIFGEGQEQDGSLLKRSRRTRGGGSVAGESDQGFQPKILKSPADPEIRGDRVGSQEEAESADCRLWIVDEGGFAAGAAKNSALQPITVPCDANYRTNATVSRKVVETPTPVIKQCLREKLISRGTVYSREKEKPVGEKAGEEVTTTGAIASSRSRSSTSRSWCWPICSPSSSTGRSSSAEPRLQSSRESETTQLQNQTETMPLR